MKSGRIPMREVRLVLPMAPDMEIIASQAATSLAAFIGMSADRIDEVRMAVVEACINAFEHSRADERTVDVTLAVLGEREPDRLEVTVRDRGVGFTPSAVEEPRLAEKIKGERKRGWGLRIIRGLMDDVRIISGAEGTTIIMSKSRE